MAVRQLTSKEAREIILLGVVSRLAIGRGWGTVQPGGVKLHTCRRIHILRRCLRVTRPRRSLESSAECEDMVCRIGEWTELPGGACLWRGGRARVPGAALTVVARVFRPSAGAPSCLLARGLRWGGPRDRHCRSCAPCGVRVSDGRASGKGRGLDWIRTVARESLPAANGPCIVRIRGVRPVVRQGRGAVFLGPLPSVPPLPF